MTTVLGLDMGGSRTRARLVRNRNIQTEAVGAGTNITAVGLPEVRRRLAGVLNELGNPGVDACCAGAAGTEDARARGELERLLTELLPGARVEVVHDSRLVLAAANLVSGLALIAGTGSVAYGRSQRGEEARAGGWGWLLGDEGGGAWLVREALRALLRRVDDGDRNGPLGVALMAAAGVSDPLALAAQLHGSREPEQWAALADAVFRAAAEDPGAQAIIEQGADSLADLAIRVAKRLGEPGPVVLAGGLLLHQPLLERAVRARLSAHGLAAIRLDDEPVAGAVQIASRLLTSAMGPETTP
ncbi:MAG: ATPase [Chloroflexi bacterium]|nr:MAG: ATPase [Chloroflexota bacterium]